LFETFRSKLKIFSGKKLYKNKKSFILKKMTTRISVLPGGKNRSSDSLKATALFNGGLTTNYRHVNEKGHLVIDIEDGPTAFTKRKIANILGLHELEVEILRRD
jgi:hypothetical protein